MTRWTTWLAGLLLAAALTLAASLAPIPTPGEDCFREPAGRFAWCMNSSWAMTRFDADRWIGLAPEEDGPPDPDAPPKPKRRLLFVPAARASYGPLAAPPGWTKGAIAWKPLDHLVQLRVGFPFAAASFVTGDSNPGPLWRRGGAELLKVHWAGALGDVGASTIAFAAGRLAIGACVSADRRRRGRCGRCAYPITRSGTCPECGSLT